MQHNPALHTFYRVIKLHTQKHRATAYDNKGAIFGVMGAESFAGLALCIAAFSFLRAPLSPLLDTIAMRILRDDSQSYGRLRMWGGLGYGVVAFLMGFIIESVGFYTMFACYSLILLLFIAGVRILKICVDNLVAKELEDRYHIQRPASPPVKPGPPVSPLQLLRRFDIFSFALTVFFMGIAHYVITSFLFVYLASELQVSKSLMGLLIAASIASEVPCFYVSPRMLSTFGHDKLLIVAHLAYVVRLLAYTLVAGVGAGLAAGAALVTIQLLHGFTFATMWASAVVRANEMAPPGMEASLQGILTASFTGLGCAVGAAAGGFVFSTWGGLALFRVSAAVVALSLALFVVSSRRRSPVYSPPQPRSPTAGSDYV
eukprot:TRINITY_DN3627_c0_g1_i1.p1 TRINITY_DN3627_c0_g1~~TRINITY_DN3627_c0_g1_i1.p1  ORF type:complete len:373 (-),score=86.91 TRINITY_DN3627_c0_g1_i1:39-1157(-)